MSFTVNEYLDLIRLLQEHPEWKAELRRLLLSDDLLSLPEFVRGLSEHLEELAEAQKRTEQRIEELAEAQKRTEQRIEELAEAQKRTEQRIEELAEAQKRTEQRIEELAEAQKLSSERFVEFERVTQDRMDSLSRRMDGLISTIEALTKAQKQTDTTVGGMKGRLLELVYRSKAAAYFGPILKKVQVVSPEILEELIEPRLSFEEFKDLLLSDLLIRGRIRILPDYPEVWLAVEISSIIDRWDIERAVRRARLLSKSGCVAIPAVAGEDMTAGADEDARKEHVVMLKDGTILFWEEILSHWLH